MDLLKKFYGKLTNCKKSLKTNIRQQKKKKETPQVPLRFLRTCSTKNVVTLHLLLKVHPNWTLQIVFKKDNNDQKLFAFSTTTSNVFKTVSNLKINKAVGVDGVSAEVPKISLSVINL